MSTSPKQLKRSPSNRVLAGVCGGLGEYLNVDPLFIRLAWVLMVLAGGFGILLYIAWIFIVPAGSQATSTNVSSPSSPSYSLFGAVVGGGLVLLGVTLLLDEWNIFHFDTLFDWSWRFAGPVLLIIGGAYLIARRRSNTEAPGQVPAAAAEPPRISGAKRFRKSRIDRKIFGVCGGVAEYFEVDPTLVRLGVAGVTLAAPPFGIIGYLALAILAPTAEPEPMPTATSAA